MEIAGMFYVYFGSEPNMEMLKNEGTYFNDVEKKLRETLLEFEKEGFTDDELQRSKNKIQAMFVDKYETTTDKAQAIMDYHYKKKSKMNVSDELNSYLSVSREDINKNPNVEITHVNLNDDTIEGIKLVNKNCFSVQYHPESSPGPHDSRYLFDDFINNMKNN